MPGGLVGVDPQEQYGTGQGEDYWSTGQADGNQGFVSPCHDII